MYRSSNPIFRDNVYDIHAPSDQSMSVDGAVNKTLLLTILILLSAGWIWHKAFSGFAAMGTFIGMGAIVGAILALITVFKRTWAPITAPLYAIFEGICLGGISALFEARYPGIVVKTVALTFTTLGAMLVLYKTKIVQPTEKFRWGVMAATGGIALVYFIGWILSFFKIGLPIYGSSLFGIIFSFFVVGIAALNLILDFDFIIKGSEQNLPKYMEWYGAFGLMVTLVWLYIELLRLLSKLNERR